MGIREMAAAAAEDERAGIRLTNGHRALQTVRQLLGLTEMVVEVVFAPDNVVREHGERCIVHLGDDVYVEVDADRRDFGGPNPYLQVVTEDGRRRSWNNSVRIRSMQDLDKDLKDIDRRGA